MLHTYSHLAEVLKTQGQLDEARRVCATYWQTVDRRDALMPDDAQDKRSLSGPFANLSHTLIDLGDWSGAEQACRRSIWATHEMFQRPPSPDVRLAAARGLAEQIPNAIGRLGARAKDRESLIAEFIASSAAARRLLNEHATLPADDKQAELIAMVQAYLRNVAQLQGHIDEARALYHEALQSLPRTQRCRAPRGVVVCMSCPKSSVARAVTRTW